MCVGLRTGTCSITGIFFLLQQVKSAERYLKRLEFHLSKVN